MNAAAPLSPQTETSSALPHQLESASSDLQRLLDQSFSPRIALEGDNMDKMVRLATIMAEGKTTVPKHLQGNIGDCMAVVMQAMNWNMNAFAVAQKTHLVNGILGYEAQLVIAVLNSSPALVSRLEFRWEGNWTGVNGKSDKDPTRKVTVWATLKGEKEPRSMDVSMAQVGDVRNSPMWVADPRQQLAYLAAKRWGRLYAPDVILGVYTPDELEEFTSNGQRPAPRTAAEFGNAARPPVVETSERDQLIKSLEKTMREQGVEALSEQWGKTLSKEQRKLVGPAEITRIKAIEPEKKSEGPSKADLLELLDIASNAQEVTKIGESCAHLSDEDRDAVHTACAEKLSALKGAANG